MARREPGRRQAGKGGGQRLRPCPTAEANALAAGAAGGESWLDHAAARRRHMHYVCSDPGVRSTGSPVSSTDSPMRLEKHRIWVFSTVPRLGLLAA